MNANELRIGNLIVDKDDNIIEVTGILENSVLRAGAYIGTPIDWVKPIPLTKEHFIERGFSEWMGYIIHEGFTEKIIFDDDFRLTTFDDVIISEPLKYLHELQNIFFSLKNIEL